MSVGKNSFTYTDQSKDARCSSRTSGSSSASKPPSAPPAPIYPPASGEGEGTAIAFQWQPSTDPDGDKIADYHFELSNRADMRWPLSMSFTRLISRTADAGKARYTLPAPGLLNPGRTYYWHVRAKDGKASGDRGARLGISPHAGRLPPWMSPWNLMRTAAWGRFAGSPAPSAASRLRTAFTPATKEDSR